MAVDPRKQGPPSRDAAGLPDQRLREVLAFIDSHLAADLSVEHLAALANLSPSCFARLFKQATDLTTCEYVNHQRVERAKRLLLTDNKLTLAQIAARVGFADQPHLTRHFKRIAGVTPGTLRQ